MNLKAFIDEVRHRMPADRADEAGPMELTWTPSLFVSVRPKSIHEVSPQPKPEPAATPAPEAAR